MHAGGWVRVIAIGVALAGLGQAPGARAAEHPPFHWDVPRVISEVPVPGELVSQGVPLRLRAVKSELSADALAEYFIGEFKRQFLYVPPAASQFQIEGGVSLTGLDTKRLISYTVIFQPNPDRTTTVILGEADLSRRVVPRAPADLPVMPGAQHVLTSTGEGALVVTFEVKATAEEVASFYRTTLTGAGYSAQQGLFLRGDRSLRVTADRAHTAGDLFVTVEARGWAGPQLPPRGEVQPVLPGAPALEPRRDAGVR